MNVAMILAGGTGTRVGAGIPKQFIEILGKPILAYTMEVFQENPHIDAMEVVCHKDWVGKVEEIVETYHLDKTKWLCLGGDTYQQSTVNGIMNLRDKLSDDDIVVSSFGVSPLTEQADIDDAIRVCELHGNAICAEGMSLCTCVMDDDESSTQPILRETLKGFANPWAFKYGELRDAYDEAIARGILDELEPHTTSLYFALGKRIWFSQCTSPQSKITHKWDVDLFEGYMLLKQKREAEAAAAENETTETQR